MWTNGLIVHNLCQVTPSLKAVTAAALGSSSIEMGSHHVRSTQRILCTREYRRLLTLQPFMPSKPGSFCHDCFLNTQLGSTDSGERQREGCRRGLAADDVGDSASKNKSDTSEGLGVRVSRKATRAVRLSGGGPQAARKLHVVWQNHLRERGTGAVLLLRGRL